MKNKTRYPSQTELDNMKEVEQTQEFWDGYNSVNSKEPCAIEEFFKQHKNDPLGPPPCALVCTCPRHRATC